MSNSISARTLGVSLLALSLLGASACAAPNTSVTVKVQRPAKEAPKGDGFLEHLRRYCGQAFEGELVKDEPASSAADWGGNRLVMHVQHCSPDEIRVPFHVGTNRSRTWIVRRDGHRLELRHDHRHEDGSPDAITLYGGFSIDEDSDPTNVRRFPADADTVAMMPKVATNVWTMSFGDETFVYQLQRKEEGRIFRASFDLSKPVTPPPLPWGYEKD
ncbi:MAG: hypothetical protein H0U74_23330 [Bradymonadaceae bacterium]|nr:hypothetical protein [Lujinxingiaceae bacterium]